MALSIRTGAAAGLALLLAAASPSPAPARAPSASDQGSMDWLLQRLAKDREEENKVGTVVDPLAAFRQGEVPLEGDAGWKVVLAIVLRPDVAPGKKNDATAALVDRFKLEDERRGKIEDEGKRKDELKTLWAVKKQVCVGTMNQAGMLGSNQVTLSCVLRIQKALLPADYVGWTESNSLRQRKKAYDDLVKKLK